MLVNVELGFRVVLVADLLEPLERELVTILELTVIRRVLLHSVICQVNEGIIYICWVDPVLERSRAEVAFGEKIEVVILGEQNPNSYVKLSLEN